MRVLFLILGMIAGGGIAWLLNKHLFSNKEGENEGESKLSNFAKSGKKENRILMQVVTYAVCIVLGLAFAAVGSLKYALNKFLDNRIEYIDAMLAKNFPNSNVMELTVDTNEFKEAIGDIQQSMSSENAGDSFLEKLVFDAFVSRITPYVNMAESGANLISSGSNEDGTVTVKTIIYTIKDKALNKVAPLFIVLQVLILIALGIFVLILRYIFKSGGNNEGVVFGEGV